EAGAIRVRQSGSELEPLASLTPGQLVIPERALPKLPVSEEYIQTIKEARPFAYWRFEELVDGKISNEMSEKFPAVLHHEDTPPTVTVENGVAMFRTSQRPRYFSVDGGIPGWNSDSFSIEIWGCPDRLHHGALVDILSEDWTGDLNTIEIAMKTTMIHPPGAYRFFHRYPPGQDMKSGINLFDHQTCTPMQWTHLVATKSRDSLSLYVNGQLLRRIEGATGSDDALYQLAIGQMDNHQLHRQFEGALDEMALYDRALTPDEVLQHYRLMMP
ncbi:MAG TPA: LamG domain-containing protein, partial [Planctomicrobium sp.]|nr:LamG domain-containing protein [Planctomicrobium sp.]